MKLSVSAYRAHASAHKKILDTAYQLNYGATAASSHQQSSQSNTATIVQIDPIISGDVGTSTSAIVTTGAAISRRLSTSTTTTAATVATILSSPTNHHIQSTTNDGIINNNSSDDATTTNTPPHSHNTSQDGDDTSNANDSDCKSPSQSDIDDDDDATDGASKKGKRLQHVAGRGRRDAVYERSSSKGGKVALQSWKNLKAVMAYYHSLRKIKRTKSNQRWMKLRTTVQISSAIQKKPPLKREDSFLKRFASRQIPETQETVEDTGSEGHGDGGATGGTTTSRRRRRQRKQPRTVVNPDENFYFYWLLVLTVCVLYNLWTLIVRQSFPELQIMLVTFWSICDWLSDMVFLLDLIVQLRTGYLEQGLMVYDSKKLACHYLRSRAFLFDIAALCPLDLLQIRLGAQPMLRCTRFLKVYRAVNYYYMVESRTVWPNLWRVINLIHILLILAHWFGCFYFLLSEAEGFQGDWVYPYRPGDYATLTRKYLGSLYWSTLTLTTIGDLPTPETNAEITGSVDGPRSLPRRGVKSRLLQFNTNHGYIFTIVSYLIGVFIFATIVGQVGNVITNRNANRLEFERLLDGAKTYMRHHKVPGGMKRRVLRWYDYSWSRGRIQGGGDINTALGLLPDKLKTELALHVNLSVLKKVTIFQECQPEFLRDLVLKMKAYIFTPGDSICRKGEVAREMFIIADGILEVLSEHGKVLTTMKAGDFFGEIGILNLDGLNKRTADVRSVGYSELFSLSREDVLAAMKDYPEAQEILQALGRKRLMEVKASAKHHQQQQQHKRHGSAAKTEHQRHRHHTSGQPHHHHHHSQMAPQHGLVDKLKNEAKGLRNVLKKTRSHRRSVESLELQPLHAPEDGARSKRTSRIRSQGDEDDVAPTVATVAATAAVVTSPLGAGLPLLQRLRLLKEKQENEEKGKKVLVAPSTATSPPLAPETEEESTSSPPIGAGLPLLQRILLLKAREDANRPKEILTKTISPPPITQTSIVATSSELPSKRASFSGCISKIAQAPSSVGKMTFRERLKMHGMAKETIETTSGVDTAIPTTITTNTVTTTAITTITTMVTTFTTTNITTTTISNQTINEPSNHSKRVMTNSISDNDVCCGDLANRNDPPWRKLKKAAISRDTPTVTTNIETTCCVTSTTNTNTGGAITSISTTTTTTTTPTTSTNLTKNRPKLIFTNRTKHYRSIDDLSPEYGGLPFVKKLKILNERQKLEELETVMKTRSFSLDIPETTNCDDTLTRSQSEGSTMHRGGAVGGVTVRVDTRLLATPTPLHPSPLHSSTESNETPERRHLRSILKKLSEKDDDDTGGGGGGGVGVSVANSTKNSIVTTSTIERVSPPTKRYNQSELRRLMRAPTIEGYAIRHSKLAKSVTFDRDTLPSPPPAPSSWTPLTSNGGGDRGGATITTTAFPFPSPQSRSAATSPIILTAPPCNARQRTHISTDLDDQPHYYADILLAIKQVITQHLHEMQDKFQRRFEKLESELNERDQLIGHLRAQLDEKQKDGAGSMGGIEWARTSQEEEQEQLLPPIPTTTTSMNITAKNSWKNERTDGDNVVLDIDTTTSNSTSTSATSDDEEDEDDDDEVDEENDVDEDEDGGGSELDTNSNWEIELLAEQMTKRRSASLDQSATRPQLRARRFLTRGGSADFKMDE